MSRGTSDVAASTFEDAQKYLNHLMETRLRIAVAKVDERIGDLGKGATRERANYIAREELEKAINHLGVQETNLFNKIDPDAMTPLRHSIQTLKRHKLEMGKARASDIPPKAKRFLADDSKDFYGDAIDIREIRNLQSTLRESARVARAAGKYNRARIADDIADSITEDIANTVGPEGTAQAVQDAVNYSRNMHQRIRGGAMGKITGRTTTGALKVPEAQTLEESIGMVGPKGREAYDQLLEVLDFQKTIPQPVKDLAGNVVPQGSSAVTIDATKDYLRHMFVRDSVDQGMVNVNGARSFLKKYDELLNRMPDLKDEFNDAITSQNARQVIQQRKARLKFNDPKISKATMYIQKGPIETYRSFEKMRASDVVKQTKNLINMAGRDATGEALEGLRSGYIEYIMDTARTAAVDIEGLNMMSGRAIRELMSKPSTKAAMNQLFPGKLRQVHRRINVISNDLVKLENAIKAKPSKEGVLSDKANKALESVVRIFGARMGRAWERATGGGGTVQIPGIFSQRMKELADAGIHDPAARLIVDSMFDEKLFRDVLKSAIKGVEEISASGIRRLNAWTAAVIADYGGLLDTEEQ
jgi:hypothetical protein